MTITEEESVELTNVARDDNSDISNLSVNGSIIACWGDFGGMVTYVPDTREERFLDRLGLQGKILSLKVSDKDLIYILD